MDFDDGIVLSHPHDFYRFKKLDPQPGTCFVLMPFAKGFDVVFEKISQALAGLMVCTRADDMRLGEHILERVLRGIATAELIIADLTGRNANVFYELGLAHTRTKDVLLLTQDIDDVPFDLRSLFSHVYSTSKGGVERLARFVRDAATEVQSRKIPQALDGALNRTRRITDYLQQRLKHPEQCKGLVVRIQAHLSSFANAGMASPPNEQMRDYSRSLEDERDLLIRLLEQGAILQAILSPYSSDAREIPDLLNARIDRLLSFMSRDDECAQRSQFVIAPITSSNIMMFGSDILFEGHKTGVERGFGWTNVITHRQQIEMRTRIFDRFYESALAYTLEQFGPRGARSRGPESLRGAVMRALETAKASPSTGRSTAIPTLPIVPRRSATGGRSSGNRPRPGLDLPAGGGGRGGKRKTPDPDDRKR